jgi:uncharacterized membrane protein YdjX (TVP38/TMEM64 family)
MFKVHGCHLIKKETTQFIARIAALVFVIAITVALYIYRNQVQRLQVLGFPGIFLVSVLANATLILPVPGVIFTAAMGAIFNPFWVAIAAGTGAAVGEMTGYLAGFSGQAVIDKQGWYDRIENWMRKYGDVTILVLAFIPNPLFDIGGMAAGALKMPWWRFYFWCALGKILKMLMFAYGGAALMHWFGMGA